MTENFTWKPLKNALMLKYRLIAKISRTRRLIILFYKNGLSAAMIMDTHCPNPEISINKKSLQDIVLLLKKRKCEFFIEDTNFFNYESFPLLERGRLKTAMEYIHSAYEDYIYFQYKNT